MKLGHHSYDYVFAIPSGKKHAIEKLNSLTNGNYLDSDVLLENEIFATTDGKYKTYPPDSGGYSYWYGE